MLPVAPPIGLPLTYHWLPLALLDVSVVLPPVQKLELPLMVGVAGIGLTVTDVAAEAGLLQPLWVTTTV